MAAKQRRLPRPPRRTFTDIPYVVPAGDHSPRRARPIAGGQLFAFGPRQVKAIDGALGVYRQALEDGPEAHLVGRPVQPAFRKRATPEPQDSLPREPVINAANRRCLP
jgi:hypothetical protein